MADATEDLERKRIELNQRADEHRAARDRLNAEFRQIADQRARILDELRSKSAEAQDHRAFRDELNENVREAKRLREEWNRRLQETSERLLALKHSRPARPGTVPEFRLRKELKELEFRHMTTVLTGEKEKKLVEEMKRIERAIREQEDQWRNDPEIGAALTANAEARTEAERHHAAVGEFAESAQREHELMVKLYESVDELRRRADEVQAKLVSVKANADELHRAHIAAIDEVHDLEKLLHVARGGGPSPGWAEEAEPPREEDFLARLKKGEKVSTEDLLELQKGERA